MTRFSPCLSRKRQSWERGLRLRFPVPPAWREKGNHGNMAGVLAMAFPPCLSSKRLFHGSHGRPWESSAGVLAIAFSSACRRKGNFIAPMEDPWTPRRECSQWPFPPAHRGKCYFRSPPEEARRPPKVPGEIEAENEGIRVRNPRDRWR